MTDRAQTEAWLAWEQHVRAAMAALKADGGHERVLRLLDHEATVAMHNAYCEQTIPFPPDGVTRA